MGIWSAEEGQAHSIRLGQRLAAFFETLKQPLSNLPVLALQNPEAKYFMHVDVSQYAWGEVHSEVHHTAENVLGFFSCTLYDAEIQYPAYDTELLGIRDPISCCKLDLHGAEQPLLLDMDHVTLGGILTQPLLTVHQMDIVMVMQNLNWETNLILGVKNQVADLL